jgi:hypothetical protein
MNQLGGWLLDRLKNDSQSSENLTTLQHHYSLWHTLLQLSLWGNK